MWVSNVSLPDGCPPLPFSGQDANTGDYIEFTSEEDAHRLFNSWEWNHKAAEERRFEFANVAGIGGFIVSADFQDVIRRKQYCQQFNVAPFPGDFDDQPKWWLTALNIIARAEANAMEYRSKHNG